MRRWGRRLFFGVCWFSLLCLFCVCAQAKESPPSFSEQEEVQEEEKTTDRLLKDFWDALPDAAKQGRLDEELSLDGVQQAVGFESLVALLRDYFGEAFSGNRGVIVQILGIALLFCAVQLCGGAFGKHAFGRIFMDAAPTLFLYRLLFGCTERVFAALSELSAFATAVSPVYVALFTVGGAVSGAAAAGSGSALFVSVLEGMVGGMLSPLLKVLFALMLLSSIGKTDVVTAIGTRLRALYILILSIACVLFTAALATEASLASAADGVAFRTVKFAVGNSIPVVGGAVSSVLGSLHASLTLIKSTFGAGSLLALFALMAPVLIELLLLRFALSLGGFLCESFGAGTLGGVFGRFRGIFDLMLASVAIVCVLFVVWIALVLGSMRFSA